MEQYKPMTLKAAVLLAAPHTWAASVLPAVFGLLYCLCAGYRVSPIMGIALFLICVLMQSGVNTTNDYFDFIKGTDTENDNVEVNDSVLVYYKVNPKHALLLGFGFLGAAALLGLAVVLKAGIAPLLIGVIGGAAVIMYSFGPCPISYLPLGELVSGFVMGGLIPMGIAAAVTCRIQWNVLLYAIPCIIGVALIMMTNNACDIEKDNIAKRYTLPELIGRPAAKTIYRSAAVIWIVGICILPVIRLGWIGLLAPAALLILAYKPFKFLLTSPLTQERRVEQMKAIIKANVFGNGAYALAYAGALIVQCLKG